LESLNTGVSAKPPDVTTGTSAAFEATCVADCVAPPPEADCAPDASAIDDPEADGAGGSSEADPPKYEQPDISSIVKTAKKPPAAIAWWILYSVLAPRITPAPD